MTRGLDEFWAHDPYILPFEPEQTYYLYTAARDEPVVLAYRSTDLESWSDEPIEVFRVPTGSWASPEEAPWAPEVHEHRGRFYLFTTLHDSARRLDVPGGARFRGVSDGTGHEIVPTSRGTAIAVADHPAGPFALLRTDGPVAPADFMTLDGTLFVDDDGRPWMVYAHEWVQIFDGTIEAVPLTDDLTAASGDPILLFRGSEARLLSQLPPSARTRMPYVTDGPQLRRLSSGDLLMIWATYQPLPDGGSDYVETMAVSRSGRIQGPWEQLDVLVDGNAGHGMLFETFDGRLMLVLHRGMNTPRVRAELHEVVEAGDRLALA
ncbi:glycoside hydrolase family 43 protein [Microbacterium hydrocarbonoxydans]|uniref:glycoside hydrolase family 43 protein n=1 Tax=Microbacterium hydrocarbonoxydans TaxID=273678 RepID=UPI0013DA29DB|nr:glycoside hydrolase family 43 protein [Microbacterium hydrocarbonoxydans]